MSKRRTSMIIGLASTLLCTLLGASAQTGTGTKPTEKLTADQIIAKHIEATGGAAAYQKLHSRTTKGTIDIIGQGIKGTVLEYAKEPNKRVEILSLAGVGDISDGFDGKTAWSKNPFTGLVEKTGVELSDSQLDSVFNQPLKWKELYATIELTGTEPVGGGDAYVVKFTPKSGSSITRFFDSKTFMMVREDSTRVTEQGTTPSSVTHSDFRAVDGIKLPFSNKLTSGPASAEHTVTEVTHNVPIDDAKFAKPTS